MRLTQKTKSYDYLFVIPIILLVVISIGILNSIAPHVFPNYIYFVISAFGISYIFSRMNFSVLTAFSWHIYIVCIILLVLPLVIGELTRGTVRWIPIGPVAIQPSEIVRPFLILFFANYLASHELTLKRLVYSGLLIALPVFLIIIQPSLGVASLTIVAYIGVILASTINKKYILLAVAIMLLLVPLSWLVMQSYQKERILSFIDPTKDPLGSGYNSIQATISVGSGKLLGRGLGEGVQTQLWFLPERHNDFIFASIGEELGFVGVVLVLSLLFGLMWRMTDYLEFARNPIGRAYISGFLLVLFAQILFNIGMNMRLFPITGIPLPLVSAGGSSLIATMIGFGIVYSTKRK